MRIRRHLAEVLTVALLLALVILFYRKTSLDGGILVGFDTFTYFYPYESYLAETLLQWRLPLWNPYLFTGVPFLANMQTGVFYPFNLIFLLFPVPQAYAYSIVLHVFLAGAFMYLLCRRSLGLSVSAAFIGANTLMFSGFFSSLVGHINQLNAAAWIPLLFLLSDRAYARRSARAAVAAALVLAVQFTAGHAQESYLTIVGLGLLIVFRLGGTLSEAFTNANLHGDEGSPQCSRRLQPARDRSCSESTRANPTPLRTRLLTPIALFVLILALGIGLAAVQLMPSFELSGLSIRAGGMTYKEAVSFSLPPWLALKSLLPVFGDPQPFSEWLGYVGIYSALLALFAVATAPRRSLIWLAIILSIVGLFFAIGQFNPLYPLALELVPGMDLFRVPARWLYLYTFGASILAAYGADYLDRRANHATSKNTIIRFLAMLAIIGVATAFFFLRLRGSVPLELPGSETRIIWLALGAAALATILLSFISRVTFRLAAPAIVVVELFAAGQGLDLNQTSLPDAYSALRPAVTHFLADKDLYRVLPISENTYDPGDIKELRETLRTTLTEKEIYDYIVATKWKETLVPNLPLRYRIASIDGYDGGMLPLRSFLDLKRLFPLREKQAPDGRLREEIQGFPDPRILSVLNVKYVLLDRVRDAWVDGVYYDLALTQKLDNARRRFSIESLPTFEATSLGVISYLSDAASVPDGQIVAWVNVTEMDGTERSFPLRAGVETSDGKFQEKSRAGGVAHAQAKKAKSWKDNPDGWDYLGKIVFPSPLFARRVAIDYVGVTGTLDLRGISLIDDRTLTSVPVVMSPSLKLDYLGDVKIYRNLDVWPRAFVVRPALPPAETMTSGDLAGQTIRIELDGPDGVSTITATRSGDAVEILSYEPERVEVAASITTDGFLVLTDSYYPGWHAIVDGVERPILRANQSFRAIELGPGTHVIRFVYEPQTLKIGILITALSAILALVVLARITCYNGSR
ncbi:MAG: YfhO family protein [Chloroflexi bacterium]|nr:YfhO family protein [Chloroflexota bacterium]